MSDPVTPVARTLDRRTCLRRVGGGLLAASLAAPLPGCVGTAGASDLPQLVWGRRGLSDGRFLKPRAITIDSQDRLYIVDTTGRVQVYDADGNYLHHWTMPETKNGRPTGLAFDAWGTSPQRDAAADPQGTILVADTHYYRMLAFDVLGRPLPDRQIGGVAGRGPGQFAFVTDAVRDARGNYYVGEYGDSDRIQKFDPDGRFLTQWGGTGHQRGQFVRPQSLVIDAEDHLWIADACNHRIQRYDLRPRQPRWAGCWGAYGRTVGKLYYPYDLAIAADGSVVVCEYGNQRLQRFARDGRLLGVWGSPGHAPGQLYQPWGVVIDSQQRVHVLDSNNHRVQRLPLPS